LQHIFLLAIGWYLRFSLSYRDVVADLTLPESLGT
jgi:transposase-like protein